MEQFPNTLEQDPIRLTLLYSQESEKRRIQQTLGKLAWFKEQRYTLTFPPDFDLEKTYTEEELRQIIENDFDSKIYKKKAEEIEAEWKKVSPIFFERASLLGIHLEPEYQIFLTRYGVGGSYWLLNNVQLNFEYPSYRDIESVMMTLAHEMLHLKIEPWIKKCDIPHWTKERLVDLMYNKIFPDKKAKLQREPENQEQVHDTFEKLFPDMKSIIMELSTAK